VTEHGISFLDLDGVSIAETVMDLGNFMAQLHALCQKRRLGSVTDYGGALLDGYDAVLASRPDSRRLAYWTALGLLQLAAKQVRRLRSGWKERMDGHLRTAREVIG
jgi:hypothetical protein